MALFTLTSPAFEDGAPIPEAYGYPRRDVNPPLSFSGIPEETESLALVMDDPDAFDKPGKAWDHWVVWNIPADVEEIPEDWSVSPATEGRNDAGVDSYGGPNPPDGRHAYRFVAYALDTTLDLPPGSSKHNLEAAIEGHVLGEATLEGTYAPLDD